MGEKWTFWLNEIGQEHNDLVGKKSANLGEMTRMGLRVPGGFCLSTKAHENFMKQTGADVEVKGFLRKFENGVHGLKEYQEASQGLRQIVESKNMPEELHKTIMPFYEELCHKREKEVPVAVRSAGTISHPGQYETYLNISGEQDVAHAIVKVWSSIFNARSIASLDRKGIAIEDSPFIGVAVIEMIEARSAGIAFTGNPMTGDLSKIMIEGNWGLGESVVSGSMTPDSFIVEKNMLDIVQRDVGDKGVQIVGAERGIMEKKVPDDKRHAPCLTDQEIRKIAEIAVILESHFGQPQDMEWAIADGPPFPENIYLLQTRPARIVPK